MFRKFYGGSVKLAKTESGYFCIAAISKRLFKSNKDDEIVWEIFEATDILTLPHSRYYCSSEEFYIFRINLSLDEDIFEAAIKKLCSYISAISN